MPFTAEERKEKARVYAHAYYIRIGAERRRQKRAREGYTERVVTVFSCTWRPPCQAIPALALGRAKYAVCEAGHRFICRYLPEMCPAIQCNRAMEWVATYPQQNVVILQPVE